MFLEIGAAFIDFFILEKPKTQRIAQMGLFVCLFNNKE